MKESIVIVCYYERRLRRVLIIAVLVVDLKLPYFLDAVAHINLQLFDLFQGHCVDLDYVLFPRLDCLVGDPAYLLQVVRWQFLDVLA